MKRGAQEAKRKSKSKQKLVIEDVGGCSGGVTGDNNLIHDGDLAVSRKCAGEYLEYANPPCFGARRKLLRGIHRHFLINSDHDFPSGVAFAEIPHRFRGFA